MNFNGVFIRTVKTIGALAVLAGFVFNVGCGAGKGKNKNSEDPLAEYLPVWTSISYIKDGSLVTLSPPFSTTQNVVGDINSGACTGNTIEVTFKGTYNTENVSALALTGITATNNSSGGEFNFVACMALGSASVTITAYDTKNVAIRSPLTLSLASAVSTYTLGLGHPRYPNTGFSSVNSGPNLTTLTSGTTTLSNVSMGHVGSKTTASTGNAGFTMETGHANYIKQLSP
jgi:hypothetical protein